MFLNIDLLLTILIFALIIFIPIIIYAIHRLGIKQNELKLFDEIEKKSAEIESELISGLNKDKCVEIEKLLIDTAQLKFELIQKHDIDRIKLILTIVTVITTIIAGLYTYKNYICMANKDRKESLDKQFFELAQKVSSSNQDEKEIAIITFPRFALPNVTQYKIALDPNSEYDNYDDFIFDFTQKYPYVYESTTIILNELEKMSIKSAKEKCKKANKLGKCENTEDLYQYFKAPFSGNIYSNTIINSLNLITKETLQNDIKIKKGFLDGYEREKISAIDLRKKDFRGIYLRNANLEGANGQNVKFSFANLSGANLSYAYLKSAEIVDANFRFTNLSRSFLAYSMLKKVDFTGANLERANLESAVLVDSVFRNAHIAHAKFNNSVLYNVIFLKKVPEILDLPLDKIIKLEAISYYDIANFKNVRCEINKACDYESKDLANFDGAIIDFKNYKELDFLNRNYDYADINEDDIWNTEYVYAVKSYLISELQKNKRIIKLKKRKIQNKPQNKKSLLSKLLNLRHLTF